MILDLPLDGSDYNEGYLEISYPFLPRAWDKPLFTAGFMVHRTISGGARAEPHIEQNIMKSEMSNISYLWRAECVHYHIQRGEAQLDKEQHTWSPG